jgi:hypothetical protein
VTSELIMPCKASGKCVPVQRDIGWVTLKKHPSAEKANA